MNGMYYAIADLLDEFRTSRFMEDVVYHIFLASSADIDLVNIIEFEDTEFLEEIERFLLGATVLEEEDVRPILKNNSPEKIRDLFRKAFTEDLSEWDILEMGLSLEGGGMRFASTVLFMATQGQCIIYDDHLYNALARLFPGEFDTQFEKPTDPASYFRFSFYCYALEKTYDFRSMSELYNFLWYGYRTNWEFHV